MNIMNDTRVYVVGNETAGYSVTFSDYILNKRLAFKVAQYGWIAAHLDYMQRDGQIGDYSLFDTSDKGGQA